MGFPANASSRSETNSIALDGRSSTLFAIEPNNKLRNAPGTSPGSSCTGIGSLTTAIMIATGLIRLMLTYGALPASSANSVAPSP